MKRKEENNLKSEDVTRQRLFFENGWLNLPQVIENGLTRV